MSIDLFHSVCADAKTHPQFRTLRDSPFYAPARGLLSEVQGRFVDPDGNFVEQFQTTGFDARTFELFLFALFEAEGHAIDRSHHSPDFLIEKDGISAAIEAVTANPSRASGVQPYEALSPDRSVEEHAVFLQNEVAIRMGSPLFTKMRNRYWELPHAANKPFIIALECFFEPGALSLTSTPLSEFMFGTRHSWYYDESGQLVIVPESVQEHRIVGKRIPSGFFNQPDAENLSGILFCNTGTIPKFNRMGQQEKYRSPGVRLFRHGVRYRHDPNASRPEPFIYEVGDPERVETWAEGTVLIRNPNAAHPIPKGGLGASVELDETEGQVSASYREEFHPYWSYTTIVPSATAEEDVRQFVDQTIARYHAAMRDALGKRER